MIKKTYRAASLSEAIHRIKTEMGPKAVIFSTVTIPAKKTLFKFHPPQVEVVASVDEKHLDHDQLMTLNGKKEGPAAAPVPSVHTALEKTELTELRKKLRGLELENENLKQQIEMMQETQTEVGMIQSHIKVSDLEENRSQIFKQKILGELIDHGISDRLITRWQNLAREVPKNASKQDYQAMSSDFFGRIFLAFRGGLARRMLFFGPPRSGKTSTLMKLACELKMDGREIAVVSLDGSQAGEVNELEVFCEELGIAYADIRQPQALENFMATQTGVEHILFDTGSVGADDRLGTKRLKNWMEKVDAVNLLVLPTDNPETAHLLEGYAALALHGHIFTGLDQVFCAGALFNVIEASGKPVYYFGTGTELTGNLVRATSDLVVSRLFQTEHSEEDFSAKQADAH